MDLASSSSRATTILFPAMQQVRHLFHPSPILRGSYRWYFFSFCIVIHRPPACEGQQYEGGHKKNKSQSEGRDEMRCDGLVCRGKEGTMQIKYARPVRNRQMRWPCCYGNTPSAVENWVWLCWRKCYKVLNQVWSQTTWHWLLWSVCCFSYRCACSTLVFLLAPFYHFGSKTLAPIRQRHTNSANVFFVLTIRDQKAEQSVLLKFQTY